jgi:hypothetical protein
LDLHIVTKLRILYIKANMSVCVSHDVMRFNMAEPAGQFSVTFAFLGGSGQGRGRAIFSYACISRPLLGGGRVARVGGDGRGRIGRGVFFFVFFGPLSFSWGWLEWRSHGLPTLVKLKLVLFWAQNIFPINFSQ